MPSATATISSSVVVLSPATILPVLAPVLPTLVPTPSVPAAPTMPTVNDEVPPIAYQVPPTMPVPQVSLVTAPSPSQIPMLAALVDILHKITEN